MRRYSIVLFVIAVFLFIAYINVEDIESILIKKFIKQTNLKIDNEIKLKKSSTLGLAIATARDERLVHYLIDRDLNLSLDTFSMKLRKFTQFKNIHFKLLNVKGKIVYSTREVLYYNHCKKLLKLKRYYVADIMVDCYGLHFAAYVPLYKGGEIVGFLEVLSQFNSIVKDLKRFDVDAVVFLDKRLSAHAKALTNSVQGYKITNTNPAIKLVRLLRTISLSKLFHTTEPTAIGEKILSTYPIKDLAGNVYGWIVYAKDKNLIYANFINRSIIIRILFLTILLAVALIILIRYFEREKAKQQQQQLRYLYNVLDNLEEIVIMNDGKRMKYANKAFFKYFDEFGNLEEFLSKHACICNFFVHEKGFLMPIVDGKLWTSYVYEHKNENIYAKIAYKDKESIFQVKANKINGNEYVVIFIDVTEEYQKEQKLRTMAAIDPLTKVYNRYYFEELAQEKIEEAVITGNVLLFAMIDIDHFKSINDTYGHIAGDEVLRQIAAIIRQKFRQTDPIFRVGGEEFLIILETSSIEKVLQLLDELRNEVASAMFASIPKHITISIGVAKYKEGDSVQTLYERADKALYEAKRTGRNRLVFEGANNG